MGLKEGTVYLLLHGIFGITFITAIFQRSRKTTSSNHLLKIFANSNGTFFIMLGDIWSNPGVLRSICLHIMGFTSEKIKGKSSGVLVSITVAERMRTCELLSSASSGKKQELMHFQFLGFCSKIEANIHNYLNDH